MVGNLSTKRRSLEKACLCPSTHRPRGSGFLDECQAGFPEIASEERDGVGPQPFLNHLGVDRSEVCFEMDVCAVVLERRIAWVGIERRCGPVESAVYASAERQ